MRYFLAEPQILKGIHSYSPESLIFETTKNEARILNERILNCELFLYLLFICPLLAPGVYLSQLTGGG